MMYSASVPFAAAPGMRKPPQHPMPIVAARARNNPAAQLVVRSQYAVKPPLLVAIEYAVVAASLGVAVYVSCGL